jgi:hypothetical protein
MDLLLYFIVQLVHGIGTDKNKTHLALHQPPGGLNHDPGSITPMVSIRFILNLGYY